MADKKEGLKTKEILNSLNSSDNKIVLKAISRSKKHGNPKIFQALLNLLVSSDDAKVEEKVLELFDELKSTEITDSLLAAVKDDKFADYKAPLISSFWKSSIDMSAYLSEFVDLAISGDYMVALECLTVVESLDGPFEEDQISDSIIMLKEYWSKKPNEEKKPLMEGLTAVIKSMED